MGATLFLTLLKTAAVTLVGVGATWLGEKIFKTIDKEIEKQQAKDELLNNEDNKKPTEKVESPTIPNVTDAPPVYEEHFVQGDSANDVPSVPAPPIGGAVPGTGTTTQPPTGAVPGTGTTSQTGGQLNWIGGVAPTKPNVLQPDGLPLDNNLIGTPLENDLIATGGQSITKEPEPNPEKPKDEETNNNNNNPGIIAPSVKDETETNIQNPVQPFMSQEEWFKFIQDEQAKRWAREDAIRKETQEREDTAYSRAIADLRKSGVNINLLGSINPAESGGGITQASGMNFDGLMNQMKIDSDQLMQLIDQHWQGDENDKNRFFNLLANIFSVGIFTTTIKR